MNARIFTDEQKQKRKDAAVKYRKQNPEKHREAVRASRKKKLAADPEHYKKQDLKRFYGVSLDWYKKTLADQNYSCAICKKPETLNCTRSGKPLNLSVDHCHSRGHIRGLLCSHCNRALGLFRDDPSVLASAIAYLKAGLS